jgi:hypothetical protein
VSYRLDCIYIYTYTHPAPPHTGLPARSLTRHGERINRLVFPYKRLARSDQVARNVQRAGRAGQFGEYERAKGKGLS